MAAFTYNEFVPASPIAENLQRAGLAVGNLVLNVAAAAKRAHERLQTRRQLEALTDRQLADIGIYRSEINAIVAKI